jgi:hypothetical protein
VVPLYCYQTRNPTLRNGKKFKMYNEHKCSLILKVTVQSNSQTWLVDDKSHTLRSTSQSGYKLLSSAFQTVWADHNPIIQFRTHTEWPSWEQKMLFLNTLTQFNFKISNSGPFQICKKIIYLSMVIIYTVSFLLLSLPSHFFTIYKLKLNTLHHHWYR